MKRLVSAFLFAILVTMVVAGPATAQPYDEPTVDVGDTNPKPGDTVDVSGDNWCPGSTVSIYLDGQFVGTAPVDANGHFDTDLVIPKNIDPGQHTITVVGLNASCTEVVSRTTTFNIAGGGVSGATLPFTGSNISVGVLLLAALVLVGTTALVAGRRRKAAHES